MYPTAKPETLSPVEGGFERRRSPRIEWRIPVIAIWEALPPSKAVRVREHGRTEEVSAHGALLRLRTSLAEGQRVEIRRPGGAAVTRGRVVRNLGLVLDGSD
ncbi:MAG: hypothetical protein ACE5HB_10860, partial [Terriglobia bacterium]